MRLLVYSKINHVIMCSRVGLWHMGHKQNFPACVKAWANEFGDHFSSPMSLSVAKKLFRPKKEKDSYFPFWAPLTLCTFKFQNGNGHLFQITQIHPQNELNGIPKASNQYFPFLLSLSLCRDSKAFEFLSFYLLYFSIFLFSKAQLNSFYHSHSKNSHKYIFKF